MKKEPIILWVASIVITFLIGYFPTLTNKDYPISGTFGIEGEKVSYRFEKIHLWQRRCKCFNQKRR